MSTLGTNPSSTVPEIFDRIVARGPITALRTHSGVYEFDVDDGGRWFLRLDHGAASLQEPTDKPDCEIHCSAADLIEIAQGKRNLFTTFLQGRIFIDGDPTLAMDVRRMIEVAA
jgi:putative sterol carrier protein